MNQRNQIDWMNQIPAMHQEMFDYKTLILGPFFLLSSPPFLSIPSASREPYEEIFQIVGTGAVIRAVFFSWDFLIFMRPNCFSVGA